MGEEVLNRRIPHLRMANRKFDQALHDLDHNDDALTSEAAQGALRSFAGA